MTEGERSYCVVTVEPAHNYEIHLGEIRRVFYRCDDHVAYVTTSPNNEPWACETKDGWLLFDYFQSELLTLEEAMAVALAVKERIPGLRDVAVLRIDNRSADDELLVRIVSSPPSATDHLDLDAWEKELGFPMAGFAEFVPQIDEGCLCPDGWFVSTGAEASPTGDGTIETHRTRPRATAICPRREGRGASRRPSLPQVPDSPPRLSGTGRGKEEPTRGL